MTSSVGVGGSIVTDVISGCLDDHGFGRLKSGELGVSLGENGCVLGDFCGDSCRLGEDRLRLKFGDDGNLKRFCDDLGENGDLGDDLGENGDLGDNMGENGERNDLGDVRGVGGT